MAEHLARRAKVTAVVDIGCGNGKKLLEMNLPISVHRVGLDYGPNLLVAKQSPPPRLDCSISWSSMNLEYPRNLRDLIPRGSLVIFSDVIEHLVRPLAILKELSILVEDGTIRYLVISTPDRDRARGLGNPGPPANTAHVQEWTLDEFAFLLAKHKLQPVSHGFTRNHSGSKTRNTQVALISSEIKDPDVEQLPRCLAFVPVYNEGDIIFDTVTHLLAQGLDVHVIDNWSTDGSFELVNDMAQSNPGLSIERFPEVGTDEWKWFEILARMETLSTQLNYEWFLHIDADERPEGFNPAISLAGNIALADKAGYEVIDFTLADSRPTMNHGLIEIDHWEFATRPGAKNLQRAWKNNGVRPEFKNSGGHVVSSHSKIFPINFLLNHLPLRSPEQARKKVFEDRISRFQKEKSERGWHTQYDSFVESDEFLWDKSELLSPENCKQREYLPEVFSRVGIEFP